MKILDNYLLRHGFVQKPVQKYAGFMADEAETYVNNSPDSDKIESYDAFVRSYQKLPWLYAAVTAVAVAAIKPELKLYRQTKGNAAEQDPIEGTPLNSLIEMPNPDMSYAELLQITVINLMLTGNAYWNLVGTSAAKNSKISPQNPPKEIWWVKPEQVTPRTDVHGQVIGYTFKNALSKETYISASEMIHFRKPNPGSYTLGLGMMEPLSNTATSEFNAVKFQNSYLENDAVPPAVFEHPGEPNADERKRFWAAWDERHKGAKKKGRLGMLWGGMKLTKIGDTMKDAQYTELRKSNREEMLAAAGVPPSIVGLLEFANYSNMEVQEKRQWEGTVAPMLDLIADKLTLRLAPYFDVQYWFKYDYSGIKVLQEDEERKARIAEAWFRTGAITSNEIRERFLNEKPYTGGNIYYVPMGLVPVGGDDYEEPVKPAALAAANDPKADDTEADPQDDPQETPQDDQGDAKSATKALTKGESFWRDGERRKQYWGAFEKRVASKERAMIPAVEKFLRQQAAAIKRRLSKVDTLEGLRPADLFDIEAEVKLYIDKFESRYRVAYEDAGEAGYRATRKELWLSEEKAPKEFKITPEALAKLRAQIEKAAKFFNSTTWETIKADIEAAKMDGDTVEELTQDLWEHLDNLSTSKARLISRTEMARVENWGGIEGYRQNEFVNKKGWMCSLVADSREDHVKADGQEVDLDAPFQVGSDMMEYPGDESHGADAGQVCNCLCTTYPIVEV